MRKILVALVVVAFLAPGSVFALDLSNCDEQKTRYIGEFSPQAVGDVNGDGMTNRLDSMAACQKDLQAKGKRHSECVENVVSGPGLDECAVSVGSTNTY